MSTIKDARLVGVDGVLSTTIRTSAKDGLSYGYILSTAPHERRMRAGGTSLSDKDYEPYLGGEEPEARLPQMKRTVFSITMDVCEELKLRTSRIQDFLDTFKSDHKSLRIRFLYYPCPEECWVIGFVSRAVTIPAGRRWEIIGVSRGPCPFGGWSNDHPWVRQAGGLVPLPRYEDAPSCC